MKYSRLLLLTVTALFALGSWCEVVPEPNWERGDFHPDPGKNWDLPSDLRVTSIIGYEDEIPASELPLAFAVTNTSLDRVTGTMPRGLCFRPRNVEYQYMIVLQDFVFEVPGDGDTVIYLPTWCANEDLDEPEEEALYDIDLQAWDRELKELYDLLQGKVLNDTFVELDMVQDALYEITDGEGLTDSTRLWLENLP
jgi:hypothetical protein